MKNNSTAYYRECKRTHLLTQQETYLFFALKK